MKIIHLSMRNTRFFNLLNRQTQSLSKYMNLKVKSDGYVFDSKKEYARYKELSLLLQAKKIKELEVHPRFLLQEGFYDKEGKKQLPIYYEADFKYMEKQMVVGHSQWVEVIEDVKGMKTDIYKLKKKMFLYLYKQCQFRES